MTQNVVITGASAGIARATAQQFGARGDNVGLLARGQAGLDGAVRDVEAAGGKALAIPTDVADYDQVEAAAQRVEEAFGPIDEWINVAFTSVFAPFIEIKPEEFRRVTEVAYLGFVYGTHVALSRMIPRDAGTIVQVGSALGYRSIPLQSAYCGAKHAINGFTESIRTELLHDKSNVHITVAQMPAVNTPSSPGCCRGYLTTRSRYRRSTSPRSPPAVSRSPPIIRSASSTGWARARRTPSSGRSSSRRCWATTWPAPDSSRSRPGRRSGRTGRTTCGSRSTVVTGKITVRTACSTARRTSTHRSCSSPITSERSARVRPR